MQRIVVYDQRCIIGVKITPVKLYSACPVEFVRREDNYRRSGRSALRRLCQISQVRYAALGGAAMNNSTFKRLAYTPIKSIKAVFRWLKSRQNIVLTVGIGAVTGLSLPLLYQLAIERHNDPTHPSQLMAAYRNNGYIALACFGALSAGYIYWMLQMLAGEASQSEDKGLMRWSDRMFLLVLGSTIATLGLWNLGMLVR